MTDKARELLERALEVFKLSYYQLEKERIREEATLSPRLRETKQRSLNQTSHKDIMQKISLYLSDEQPTGLDDEEIGEGYYMADHSLDWTHRMAFKAGVRFAEKHHGIGDEDE